MEDIAGRQRGFKYDESRTAHRDGSIGGTLGMSDPAPSILTSLARRCVCVLACVRARAREIDTTDANPAREQEGRVFAHEHGVSDAAAKSRFV